MHNVDPLFVVLFFCSKSVKMINATESIKFSKTRRVDDAGDGGDSGGEDVKTMLATVATLAVRMWMKTTLQH